MNNNETTTKDLILELHDCELLITRLKRQLYDKEDNNWLSLLVGIITGLGIGYTIF